MLKQMKLQLKEEVSKLIAKSGRLKKSQTESEIEKWMQANFRIWTSVLPPLFLSIIAI